MFSPNCLSLESFILLLSSSSLGERVAEMLGVISWLLFAV